MMQVLNYENMYMYAITIAVCTVNKGQVNLMVPIDILTIHREDNLYIKDKMVMEASLYTFH